MPQWSDQFPWYIKQPIDQTAHFVATFAGVWALGYPISLLMPDALAVGYATTIVLLFSACREIHQFANREKPKWGDVALDVVFLWWGMWLGAKTLWDVVS